ncbi:hypothetical protein K469DRAFT_795847 [Zopfia rhizophila CBS 207.26]|uniref:Uncharacterized protein n=1 Tax=Zopfia rhizophila CBS 207.26 TaxID=1314779 RepID=A0A6A6ENK4_9PEZI|nr:hypothetical protein K469DRAFT_795847 [Zopfia rhizophila CBS 207.26]
MSHKLAIENNPLQAYASALLFSPARSLIRRHFRKEEPDYDKANSNGARGCSRSKATAMLSTRSPFYMTQPGSRRCRPTAQLTGKSTAVSA